MPERDGYKTLDLVAKELNISDDEARAFINVLNIQPRTFREDRRVRYYSPEDIAKLKELIQRGI